MNKIARNLIGRLPLTENLSGYTFEISKHYGQILWDEYKAFGKDAYKNVEEFIAVSDARLYGIRLRFIDEPEIFRLIKI